MKRFHQQSEKDLECLNLSLLYRPGLWAGGEAALACLASVAQLNSEGRHVTFPVRPHVKTEYHLASLL